MVSIYLSCIGFISLLLWNMIYNWYVNKSFQIVQKLVRILPNGQQVKREVDFILDECFETMSPMHFHIREVIFVTYNKVSISCWFSTIFPTVEGYFSKILHCSFVKSEIMNYLNIAYSIVHPPSPIMIYRWLKLVFKWLHNQIKLLLIKRYLWIMVTMFVIR